ncbi:proton-coupled folate transporter-like isoform X1 [Diorhabda sublineata]|uniref:proton-coupled folate transporter-like isoform X1 n=1 Tax=Diorhabda sublineata TaxID=1163346 RepID=UPI0024E11AC3|nr:proton-coupled folate transporter-like isoform X1 [Diorhabda sublineata]
MVFVRPTIEIPLILFSFTFELLGPVNTNLMLYRTCYVILGFNQSECALLGNTEDNNETKALEEKVQPMYNVIETTRSMVENVIGLALCLFLGPISDKFGRKPIILISHTGMVFALMIMTVLSYFPNVSPWYFMLSSIPSMLTGGSAAFFVSLLSYISDISTNETRGMRMALFEASFSIGMLIGNFSGSYIFYATNYPAVYAIATVLIILNITYIYFFVPESTHDNINREFRFNELCNVVDLKEMFKVLVKAREKYNRSIIMLITAILTVYVFLSNGDSKLYLLLRDKFGWNYTHYTFYSGVSNLLFTLGTISGTYILQNLLNVTESVAILLGIISAMNGYLIRGLATTDFHIYFSVVVKLLGAIISPQCRTLVAKLVPADEIAKIFSLIIFVQFIVSIAASPFYTMIYNVTVNTNPAEYNFVSAGLFSIDIILILVVMVLEFKSTVNYEKLKNEESVIESDQVIET